MQKTESRRTTFESGMASWNTLPAEIHDDILKFFCQDVITEYIRKYKLFDAEKASREPLGLLTWPSPPQPLIDFSSALRTSRSFHQSLHRFKIKGNSPSRQLQVIQRNICWRIRKKAHELLIEDRDDYGPIDVAVFMEIAGVFWKNPLILDMKSRAILDIMLVLNTQSLVMLVPHIEEWVLSHAVPVSTRKVHPFVALDSLDFQQDPVVFGIGFLMVRDSPRGWIRSVKGLYQGSEFKARRDKTPERQIEYARRQMEMNERLVKLYPVFEELGKGSGEWWLFSMDKPDSGDLDDRWWIIVDYRGKRMWGDMSCKQKLCFWDDVWEVKTWTVGQQEPLGEDWFISYDNYWGYSDYEY